MPSVIERDMLMNPYMEFDRAAWSALRDHTPLPLTEDELGELKGLNDQVSLEEVEAIYLPLTHLLNLHIEAAERLRQASAAFLHMEAPKVPFVLGIAGSVAVGKSTTARLLQRLLSMHGSGRKVDLVTTDGFLYPKRILEERGLMKRKGFPESYAVKTLMDFMGQIKSGNPHVEAPLYSHLTYDIIPGQYQLVEQPDVLIVEGINVLQVSKEAHSFVSDFFDFSIFVDAPETFIERWYVERFLMLRHTAFKNKDSYFHRYASLTDEEAVETAATIWKEINAVNLYDNILPTKRRAMLILQKDAQHRIQQIQLRK